MSFTVNTPQSAASVCTDIDLGPAGNSVQLMFARLQLSQSALCKDEATKRMKEIQDAQSLQKEISSKIAEARRLQDAAKEKGTAEASQEFVDFCKANGIALPNDGKPVTSYNLNDLGKQYLAKYGNHHSITDFLKGRDVNKLTPDERNKLAELLTKVGHMEGNREIIHPDNIFSAETKIVFTAKEWESIVKSLTDKQELLGGSTQTVMVYLQDFIGQYNSFLQGANTAIATANQVLTGIAKGQ